MSRQHALNASDLKPDCYEVNAKICRLVERHPCMYDRKHDSYLRKDVVERAWIQIAKEMDDSIPSCKERWRNIRTSFARSINVRKVPPTTNRTKPYYLHNELRFLANHITPGVPVRRGRRLVPHKTAPAAATENMASANSFDDDWSDGNRETPSHSGDANQLPTNNNSCFSIDDDDEAGAETDAGRDKHKSDPKSEAGGEYVYSDEGDSWQPPPQPHQGHHMSQAPSPRVSIGPSAQLQPPLPEQCYGYAEPEDFDLLFLRSVLPDMRNMNFHQKLLFKRRVLEVVAEVFEAKQPASGNAAAPSQLTANDLTKVQNLNWLLRMMSAEPTNP